jgi:hypothetical protein
MPSRGPRTLISASALALALLPLACRGGGDLPSATLAAPTSPAAEEEPADLAPAPPTTHVSADGPRLYARALETRVLERPDPRSRVLGYLRLGQSVPRSSSPVPGVRCDAGWYEVLPRGYVCLDAGATLDPADPVVRALGTRPDLSKPMPYLYGFARRDATLWHMVPDHKLMDRWEYGFQNHLKDYRKHHAEWNRIKSAGANQVPLDEYGNAKTLPGELPPLPPPLDEEHFFPDLGDGQIPWWLQGGTRKIPNLSSFVAPDGAVPRGKVSRHAGLAILGSFRAGKESDHRKFAVLLDGRLIGEDKIKPHLASPFHGIALDGSLPFPFAMVRRRDAETFDRSGNTTGHLAYGDIVRLNGKLLPRDQRFYFETEDRRWLREDQVAVFDTPPPPTSFDWKKTKWVDVSIQYQSLVLYEGERPVYATLVSTGVDGWGDPKTTRSTVQGEFRIDYKHVTTTMDADDPESHFELRDVPWVQYFEGGYALHAAYWHDDFGRARSHGCVNLSPVDARRLFFWTDPPLPEGWHAVKSGRAMGPGTWVRVRR